MNEPEKLLWSLLRHRRFSDFKFRRQAPLGDYVVDFVCFNEKLVLELDGAQRSEAEQATFDAQRSAVLEAGGFRVVRVWVEHLYSVREGVLETIWQALNPTSVWRPD